MSASAGPADWMLVRRFLAAGSLVLALLLGTGGAFAVDPPYQPQMRRLIEITGSLYFLQPLCGDTHEDWRAQAADLIALDEPDADRKTRLIGAFNEGYQNYARLYRTCTPAAREAVTRLLEEAEKLSRDIHTRYAE